MTISHVCGSIIVQAKGSFLNGSGSVKEGKEAVGMPKAYQKNGILYPYVSAQCWRRWWKASFVENILPAIASDPIEKKYATMQFLNPIDDIFGYFEASERKIDIADVNKVNVSQIRSSPVQITQLHPIQQLGSGTHPAILKDKAYVHLKEGTPLPYTSKFYNADLEAMFVIDVNRIASYTNFNDRQEFSPSTILEYQKSSHIVSIGPNRFQARDADILRKKRVIYTLESLLTINGGAKSAQYGTDISPKAILVAGTNGGNPLLSRALIMGKERPRLDLDRLIAAVSSNPSLFETSVFCGIRQDYIENMAELTTRKDEFKEKTGREIIACSPLDTINKLHEVMG